MPATPWLLVWYGMFQEKKHCQQVKQCVQKSNEVHLINIPDAVKPRVSYDR